VILSGGAFNTPQLLILSGVGAKPELDRLGIRCRVDLPGVGANLQDRYEVSVVHRTNKDWEFLSGAEFTNRDRQFAQWEHSRSGVYASNGGVLAIINRSAANLPLPDLFIAGLLGRFEGYFPGYSKLVAAEKNYLTWIILKAHTANRAGTVTLRSADPRDPPAVNFRYFHEGSDSAGADLAAVVEGIRFVRAMSADLAKDGSIVEEVLPGKEHQNDEELREYVRNNAWGHHASCSCPIGARDTGGVLTSDFRVHGTQGLRVVDASVFPRIPGFFIASAVYMIGEKAADVIHADNGAR
jgi:choline dehydrogenase-like flavoprotein